ncbi:MAG TPA: DinB family protein [Bryobacteraceae bacterium]|nr:DinB family protein [Bryobacteraceae bacterium]
MNRLAGYTLFFFAVAVFAQPKPPQTPAQRAGLYFKGVNDQVLDMAKDFPEDKYGFKLKPEMRSFGDVIVHVASGNIYGAKAGRGEKVKWDELDPKDYKSKAEIVALLEKSIAEANATLAEFPEGPNKNLEPWLAVMQHSSEHYGLLVAYYRANGLVPPASRPKK